VNLSYLINGYCPQSSPFSTHVNLLRSLGGGVRSVLELGMGEFSTNIFLDKNCYPDLTLLASVESDPSWAKITNDPRHVVHIVEEPIETLLADLNLDDYDLIFADNSTSGERRCATLFYLSQNVNRSIVIAHDYDVPSYREACREFNHVIVDDRQKPNTAMLWRTGR
jgi:hypothetical protein